MSNANNTVSILIPTFQRPEKLKRAIESARAQVYTDIVILVFDNASGDETAEVVSGASVMDPRVQYHCHKDNIGVITNYNYAMGSVSTKYFAFLGDDDVLLPECILHAVRGLELNPKVVFWGGGTIHVDESSGHILRRPNRSWRKGGIYSSPDACKRICSGNHFEFQGLVFRTEMVRKHQICFSQDIMIPDIDMELQLAKRHPVGATPFVTAIMYSHSGSISSGVKSLSTFWPTMGIIGKRFSDDNPLTPNDIERCLHAWRRFTLETIWYIAAKCSVANRNDEASRAARVLEEEFPDGVLPRIAQWCIIMGTRNNFFSIAMWIFHLAVRALIHPSILLDRILRDRRRPEWAK
jgi:glycosyltransferase involved in cell wall biosynthesis